MLFLNKHITTPSGRSLFYPDLIKKGIYFVDDVVANRRLKSPNQIKQEKNLNGIELMHYTSLYACIKRMPNVNTYVQTGPENCILPDTSAGLFGENSKSFYRKLIEKISEHPTSEAKLSDMFDIQQAQFKNIYRVPFLVTIETKMRAFQFKINHLIYYTNQSQKT